MTSPVSATRQWCDVAGIRSAYRDTGSGIPVLLIHGGDPRATSNLDDWGRYAELLSQNFRVVAVDKLGQGYTDNPLDPSGFTMSATCEHLRGLVDVLGLDRFVVAGHSRGALPATYLALTLPDRVRGLVIFDSNTLGPDDPSVPLDFYTRIYEGTDSEPTPEHAIREPILNSYSFGHVDAAFLASRRAVAELPERRRARADMVLHYLNRYEPDAIAVRDRILDAIGKGELSTDTLLIWGREDPSAPLPVGLRLFDLLVTSAGDRRTEFQLVEGCGHYPFREHPESSAERTARFIRSLDFPHDESSSAEP